jgi:hypothetical protein
LAALVAATQQQDDRVAAPLEIDPVAGSIVNPQFADPLAHRLDISTVPVSKAIKTGKDRASGAVIPEALPPLAKRLCLFEFDHSAL